ncbi:iron uptake system protein EfeO [Aquihabitans sp. McL0605]|uniref:iron uptake system protein EfeO n=1 Tax=Aquihabitans sp. McL0605 TaxID=3415671 RepID=UPI003CF4E770
MSRRSLGLLGALLLLVPVASACTDNNSSSASSDGPSSDSGKLTVTSTGDKCTVSGTTAPSGTLVFKVTNKGSQVTEFYLLGEDGLRIVGEVENIGPGLTRDLVVQAAPGKYTAACKPGMVGDGIRSDFTVTKSGSSDQATGKAADLLATATSQYAAYVRDQTEQLVTQTKAFAEAYRAGDDDKARALYASARMHWERIEPVAESFGDLDPRLDLREADLEAGQEWTGWHRIEKDLWPQDATGYTPATQAQRKELADQLVADTQELYSRTRKLTYTPTQLGNGAKELLDEVATGKVTGEEEAWSHTDLWDFQANVDGARIAFENLEPALKLKDPQLAKTLAARFAALQVLLDQYAVGDGFKHYDELTKAQVKELADSVNALSEPLSKLTAAVVL